MAHDDSVLRHFVANIDFLGSSDLKRWKDSGAILLAFKLSTVGCQALKHTLAIHETPNSLLMI